MVTDDAGVVQYETRNSSSGVGSSEYDLAAVIVHHGSGYVSAFSQLFSCCTVQCVCCPL